MVRIWVDETIRIGLEIESFEGIPVNATSGTLKIFDPQGAEKVSKELADMVHDGTGLYHYYYDTPSNVPKGIWGIEWKGIVADLDAKGKGEFVIR